MEAGRDGGLRIAITGAQGTGKTTLAERLSGELGLPLIPESSREVARRLGIAHLSQLSVDGFARFEKLCLESQLSHERRHAAFVSDRCTLDGAVYWLKWLGQVRPPEETEGFISMARENMANYDHVFYLPVEFSPQGDGFRSTDRRYQREVDGYFTQLFREWEVDYHPLSGSLDERLQSALQRLAAGERRAIHSS
jgi:nicotinamide riboside kinase